MVNTRSNTTLTKKTQWVDYAGGSSILKPFIGIEVFAGADKYHAKINGTNLQKSFKTMDKAKEYAIKIAIKNLEKITEEFKELLDERSPKR